ncbi:MAG TPA: hypothetical protein VMW92_06565 [Candidatus Heimdallarchaeota archaeon]|nr:hypothetical protein [Candidatus Heimdallarchaeota archaeon]
MKSKTSILIILAVFFLSSFLIAQETETQTIELPQKTLEYKVERGVINTLSWIFAGIAYAKSKGDTPEDFARYGFKSWGSYWKDLDIKAYIQKWHRIFSTDFHFKMEILNMTETSVEARMTIFARRCAETFSVSGVTEEEYIRFISTSISSMAEYLGWKCRQKLEGEWLYITVSEKE